MSVIIKKIKLQLVRTRADALFVTSASDVRYIAGFYLTGMMILISRRGQPVCFADTMNRTLAESLAKRVKSGLKFVFGSPVRDAADCIKSSKLKRIGFSSADLSVSLLDSFTKILPGVRFLSVAKQFSLGSFVKNIREIKTPAEIRILRGIARETVSVWRKVKKQIRPGIKEKEIAIMIDSLIVGRGYENSFLTIVAAGKNTAYPHAIATSKCLKKDEHLLVDFGIKHKGYCSDLTRVYLNGRIDGQIRSLYKSVREAQNRAIKTAKPGVKISDLVKTSYSVFDETGLSGLVLHGLGHGIGLDVHEDPFLHTVCDKRLKKGMVMTFEPGLYKEGLGGIRWEDMILITSKGCEVLTV